jgi:heat shock protein HslJ
MANFSTRIAVLLCLLAGACTSQTTVQDNGPMNDNSTLQGTAWWVEDIAGKGVIDRSHTTIKFLEEGKVSGDTGCNRYFGSYEITGETLTFGPLASTRRACAESLMNQEMAFLETMAQVSHWTVAQTGLLHLHNPEGKSLIRASATDE